MNAGAFDSATLEGIRVRSRMLAGRSREELSTPALVLDLDAARRNIDAMAAAVSAMPAELRPHIKVHKSPELAQMQVAAGAIGVSTATAWEALAMARAGIPSVFVANEVVGAAKVAAIVEAARHAELIVAIDSAENARELAAAASAAGIELGALIDVDTGMGRCGVRSAGEALALAEATAELEGLRLRGVSGYEGHCMVEPTAERRAEAARDAMALLTSVAGELAADGHRGEIISAGGTGTFEVTGRCAGVTELQAGSYVAMDSFHADLIGGFEVAVTVQASVLSRHGDLVILDAGRKAIGVEPGIPHAAGRSGETIFVNEEHLALRLAGGEIPHVGDQLALVSGYAPATVNLYDVYHVLEDGVVVDLWPVHARYGSQTTGV